MPDPSGYNGSLPIAPASGKRDHHAPPNDAGGRDPHKIPVKVNSRNHPGELPVSRELRASAEVVRTQLRAGFLHAGRELSRAKKLCEHGEWLPYLELCAVPARWAQMMMRAARAVDAGEVPEDLSLRATLATVADKRSDVSHLPAQLPAPAPDSPDSPELAARVAELTRLQAALAEAHSDMEHWQQRTSAMQLENRRLERIARRHGLIDGKGRTV